MSKIRKARILYPIAFAIMTIASAQAAPITVNANETFSLNGNYYAMSGSAVLAYSGAKIGNDNIAGIVNSAIAPATYDSFLGTSTAAITNGTFDNASGAILQVQGAGGGRQVAVKNGLMTGGTLDVTDMSYNSATKTLYANVHGVGNVAGDLGTVNQMAFFTVNYVTGSTLITGAGSFSTRLSGLYLTSTAMDYITKALGLGSLAANLTKGTDFGVMTSTWNVSKAAAPIPEPSALKLMVLGLLAAYTVSLYKRDSARP
ncbi:hypothetical protein JY96_13500 [Aquabacterium sp. NJ1]|uniref:hypothetical protein n=1 Tax=Aquabacterium sp. NJ1 TaxID=1538295 RepID=UPI00052DAAEB|nr:hypothetical protein [Aquabacterium sp. NJ1]KGM40717.1 hypothetical protein JY96_13500 [Aquabacterium sp. NJ1]